MYHISWEVGLADGWMDHGIDGGANMQVIKATIKFTRATGRLQA